MTPRNTILRKTSLKWNKRDKQFQDKYKERNFVNTRLPLQGAVEGDLEGQQIETKEYEHNHFTGKCKYSRLYNNIYCGGGT